MPVVFLPKPKPAECQSKAPSMSAFGFMSFAIALVNGVVNQVNNVNNNNNNNNNNDNNNNNNVANINIANANNNANNENMATAGRRRKRLNDGRTSLLQRVSGSDGKPGYEIRAIRVGYIGEEKKRARRFATDRFREDTIQQATLAAFFYISFVQHCLR